MLTALASSTLDRLTVSSRDYIRRALVERHSPEIRKLSRMIELEEPLREESKVSHRDVAAEINHEVSLLLSRHGVAETYSTLIPVCVPSQILIPISLVLAHANDFSNSDNYH